MKCCSYCGENKPKSDFHKRSASDDGLAYKCKVCTLAYQKGRRENLPDRIKEISSKCYYKNQEKELKHKRDVYTSNKEVILERNRLWRLRNPDYNRRYYKLYRDKVLSYVSARSAAKINATPSWLTQQNLTDIESVYALARDCELVSGEKYHVDHIVPLRGETVCGLHVPWNLQVLPSDINLSKSNTYNDWQD